MHAFNLIKQKFEITFIHVKETTPIGFVRPLYLKHDFTTLNRIFQLFVL